MTMMALDKVLFYFDFRNIDVWNLYFCNSFLFNLKPKLNKKKDVVRVFPPLLFNFFVRIPTQYNNSIVILRNYKAMVCITDESVPNVCIWYVIPVCWVRYIFYRNKSFYLSNVEFCCRHNIIHETEWPDYIVFQPMSIELSNDVRLFPLFHYGISKCEHERPRNFKIYEIGGVFEDVEFCCEYGFHGSKTELSNEVKIVLSHHFLSIIMQIMYSCKFYIILILL